MWPNQSAHAQQPLFAMQRRAPNNFSALAACQLQTSSCGAFTFKGRDGAGCCCSWRTRPASGSLPRPAAGEIFAWWVHPGALGSRTSGCGQILDKEALAYIRDWTTSNFTGKANFRSWSASQIVPDRGRHVAGSARSWQARGRSGYHSTARLRVARETVARLADPGVASARWPSVEDRGRHVPGSARSCQAVQHLSYTTDARAQVARWVTSMTAQHMNVLHSRAACASAGGGETKPRRAEP